MNGKCKITFVICISPSISAASETFSTLQFANRAKKAILNDRSAKREYSNKCDENYEELLKAYLKVIIFLLFSVKLIIFKI